MIGAMGIVIYGGDWNIHLNPKLDSSKNSHATSLINDVNTSKINVLLTELGILDLWRDFYPSGRDYILLIPSQCILKDRLFFCITERSS